MKTRWCFGIDNFTIPTKSNCNQIFFNPTFWNSIKAIVGKFRAGMAWKKTRGGNPYWIGPTKEVEDAQEFIAWHAKEFIRKDITGPVEIRIEARGLNDCDNVAKIVLDGIQQSGRLKNDRQVRKLTIEIVESRTNKGFTCEVTEI